MLPLSRFRIVELGIGPVSGMAATVLADFGADVIKVVPPGGDPFRAMGSWPLWTRGKRIVRADLRDEATQGELRRLIRDSADAVVTTLNPEQRKRLRLDPESLGREDLVVGVISGFGTRGRTPDIRVTSLLSRLNPGECSPSPALPTATGRITQPCRSVATRPRKARRRRCWRR